MVVIGVPKTQKVQRKHFSSLLPQSGFKWANAHTDTFRAYVKMEMLGLKRHRSKQKVRACWSGGTWALESKVPDSE